MRTSSAVAGAPPESAVGPPLRHEDRDGKRALAQRRDLGAEGERRAAAYLESRGYRIVERNGRPGGIEVDLIARRGRWLVFVEVKTRRTQRFGRAEAAVDAAKQARLVRAAHAWLCENPQRGARVRFDVIALHVRRSGPAHEWRLSHLESAFDAGG